MEKQALTKNAIINQLTKSVHGKLDEYVPVVKEAAEQEPDFLAHLIAWDAQRGQVKDSKVALPTITLGVGRYPEELLENSLAHLAKLDPRMLVRAFRFAKGAGAKSGRRKKLIAVVQRYLRQFEQSPSHFDAVAVQHRVALKELYVLSHTKPGKRARAVIWREDESGAKVPYPKGSVFEVIPQLKSMSAADVAVAVLKKKIPTLVVLGALGERLKETDVAMALIGQMSPTELTTNAKLLEKLGVNDNPVLKAAFQESLDKAKVSKKATLKTSKAVDAVSSSAMKEKFRGLQEKQIQSIKGIDGNWLVLGDKSGSMSNTIGAAREVAATLAKMVRGDVHLVFFDTSPTYFNVTGLDYDQLMKATKYVNAAGGTSIGCGLTYAVEKKLEIDGIAIVSDGGENQAPFFAKVYAEHVQRVGKAIPVYFYRYSGDNDSLTGSMREFGLQEFDMRKNPADFYSLPNLVQTMRANRYSLIEEIYETPLLTLKDVFDAA